MQIPRRVTRQFISQSINNGLWGVANNVLYSLCKRIPKHKEVPEVVAKLWLIGRSYAAPIERGAGGGLLDKHYQKTAECIIASEIDGRLSRLKELDLPTSPMALEIHSLLVSCLPKKNGRANSRRSMASKYLHFHRPDNFVLLDSRAKSSASKFLRTGYPKLPSDRVDRQYAIHAWKCERIRAAISQKFNVLLSNREIDELLLAIFDRARH